MFFLDIEVLQQCCCTWNFGTRLHDNSLVTFFVAFNDRSNLSSTIQRDLNFCCLLDGWYLNPSHATWEKMNSTKNKNKLINYNI